MWKCEPGVDRGKEETTEKQRGRERERECGGGCVEWISKGIIASTSLLVLGIFIEDWLWLQIYFNESFWPEVFCAGLNNKKES